MADLEHRLEEAGGTATTLLSEARAASRADPHFQRDLIRLCLDPRPNQSIGATWILKAELEEGASLAPAETRKLIASLNMLTAWQSALHLCQCADRLTLSEAQAGELIGWARTFETHKRPFLRAWSFHVRVVFGRRFAKFAQEVDAALKVAEADEAASVRARARQLKKL